MKAFFVWFVGWPRRSVAPRAADSLADERTMAGTKANSNAANRRWPSTACRHQSSVTAAPSSSGTSRAWRAAFSPAFADAIEERRPGARTHAPPCGPAAEDIQDLGASAAISSNVRIRAGSTMPYRCATTCTLSPVRTVAAAGPPMAVRSRSPVLPTCENLTYCRPTSALAESYLCLSDDRDAASLPENEQRTADNSWPPRPVR
jgi:hypothetical protein